MNSKSLWTKIKSLLQSGLTYVLCGNFLSKFVAMFSSIVIVRLTDKTQYAYLAYADNLYSYITLFSGLGLASALLVTCTDQVSKGKHVTYLRKALQVGGGFEFVLSLLLCIGAQFVTIPFPEARKYMWLLSLYPLLTYAFNCFQAYIRVLRNNKLYAKLGATHTIVVCLCSIVLALLLDVVGVVGARYVGVLLVFIMAVRYLRGALDKIQPERLDQGELRYFLSTGTALMFANVFSGMMPINEGFIVNNLIRDEIITANFKVAGIIPSMLPIITSSVMVYYFPIIASMTDYTAVKKKVHRIAVLNAAIIVPVTLLGMLFTPLIIQIVYGSKYADAASLSYALWIMRAVNAAFRMVPLNILAAIGKSKMNAIVSAASCVLHAVLDYIFISVWKIEGIAYAAIIVYILSGIVLWFYFNRSCDRQATEKQNSEEG